MWHAHKILHFLIVFWVLMLGFSVRAMVDIGDIGVGARTLAKGKAYVADAGDASSIFTNPAGLALISDLNILSMSGTILTDVNYLLFGVADSSPMGQIGFGYVNASIGGIPVTEITGTGSTAAVVQSGTTDYSSSIISFSYATKLSRFFRGNGEDIYFGAKLKYFLQGFTGGGDALYNALGTGMDADLGLMWKVKPWATLGLALNNCMPSSLGGRFIWQKNDETESIPLATRLGGAFKILGKEQEAIRQHATQRLDLLFDYGSVQSTNRPAAMNIGLEYWPMDILALRCGIDQKPKASEAGIGADNNLTAGVGIKFNGFSFDYAFHQFGELSENATHFFSIGFVGPSIDGKYAKKNWWRGILPFPEVAPKPILKSFKDLSEDYWAKKPIEYLATLGIMGGYPDQTFRPNKLVTRGELAALLVKAKGFDVGEVEVLEFSDVNVKEWIAPYVTLAIENKYMQGFSDKSFKPQKNITHAEAAGIFARFAGLYVKSQVTNDVYKDVPRSHWAAPEIAACKLAGFYEYVEGDELNQKEFLTRAEVAEILSKTPSVKSRIKELISGEK
ncbi:hypothetical protein A3H38_04780 [candidate division WOR-1 bacterium RIFCSPLOWO2_02_FULL_46_20]|uniref:SLH domain-containing protein n=2 Tax=Saganbacteria TaxID=1703751 RepID=A0A1F4RB79_UNCSA|nr:MAG: hypothetical protein A3J44_00335 [candidate division WOR-1 bacterium RIFCSPHIGHO2_02_FULL_45_12]OGC05427.1 MAG: hypothetical protein A3H38_04780 [candidate division WOR-1 bacterium RIFCSPLOWO2_02_FULL_46_20]